MNLLLPAKKSAAAKCISEPLARCMSSGSRFGSSGPLVMSCNFRSVNAGTIVTPFVGAQPRQRQIAAIEVHDEGLRLAHPQVAERVVGIGLRVQPAVAVERQLRHMAASAQPILREEALRLVSTAASMSGSRGMTRPGTAIAA